MNKTLVIVALAVLALSGLGSAHATNGNAGNGKGGCGVGQKTNGCGGSQGGAGGNGGAGGTGVGVGVGVGKANASSRSTSNAAAVSNARGGSARATGGNAQAAGGTASATGGQGGSSSAAGGQGVGSVSVTGDTYQAPRAAAASAYAPSQYPTANCALTTGIGASAVGGSFSVGSSHIDENCARIERAKATLAMGDYATAQEVMCGDAEYRAARKRAGTPCWVDRPENAPKLPAGVSEQDAKITDPFIRRRLGLPELAQ